jgi:hypothetical protein
MAQSLELGKIAARRERPGGDMRRRSRAASKPAKGRVLHASGRKPRKALTRRASAADLQQQLDRAVREREEAFEREAATAEILRVISHSPTDTQPVFEAIVRAGLKLFPAAAISIALAQGDEVRMAAVADLDPAHARAWRSRFPFPLSRDYMHGVAILDAKVINISDVANAPADLGPGAQNFLASDILGLKPAPRFERRGQDGPDEADQRDHCPPRLGDSLP